MIPILSADKLRQADAHTIAHEPIASINLMERAALACAKKLMETLGSDVPVVLLAGMGNNGGDGLAMARILHVAGHTVKVLVPRHKQDGSPDYEVHGSATAHHRLAERMGEGTERKTQRSARN